jgi:hypothetical protein
MRSSRVLRGELRSLAFLLMLVGGIAAAVITSCGGGGGDDDGVNELCDQCGVTDGPCDTGFSVEPGPDQPPPCDVAGAPNPCPVTLVCRRKIDSSQQRCYPADPDDPTNPNAFWRCDGSRPGPTALPEPTGTPVPTSTGPTPACGNNRVDDGEVCDGTDLDGESCLTLNCSITTGTLRCSADCNSFNTTGCGFCSGG